MQIDDLLLVVRPWRIFPFFVLKLKMIMKSLVSCPSVVLVCYRFAKHFRQVTRLPRKGVVNGTHVIIANSH